MTERLSNEEYEWWQLEQLRRRVVDARTFLFSEETRISTQINQVRGNMGGLSPALRADAERQLAEDERELAKIEYMRRELSRASRRIERDMTRQTVAIVDGVRVRVSRRQMLQ